jgi:hypothetical protein
MTFRRTARSLSAVAVLAIALSGAGPSGVALAQQQAAQPAQPKITPTAMLLAKELVDLKGAAAAYDPLVVGVIEYHKNFYLQNNPNLSKDLNEVAQKLAGDLAPRKVEMQQEITRIYASHFTEQELKDALAFYKSPLGQKIIAEEPKALEETLKAADDWSRKFAIEVDTKFRAEMQKRGKNLI